MSDRQRRLPTARDKYIQFEQWTMRQKKFLYFRLPSIPWSPENLFPQNVYWCSFCLLSKLSYCKYHLHRSSLSSFSNIFYFSFHGNYSLCHRVFMSFCVTACHEIKSFEKISFHTFSPASSCRNHRNVFYTWISNLDSTNHGSERQSALPEVH